MVVVVDVVDVVAVLVVAVVVAVVMVANAVSEEVGVVAWGATVRLLKLPVLAANALLLSIVAVFSFSCDV